MIPQDVLIIGAGASGSTAGFHLAKAGRRVSILDKCNNEQRKPCSGGMASSVQRWLPFDLQPVIDEIVNQVDFSWKLNDHVIAELPGSSPFWIVKRENLDRLILNEATKMGAEFIPSFKVLSINKNKDLWEVISDNGNKLISKAIIIADGSNSPWAKTFSLGPKVQHHASTLSLRLNARGNLKPGTTRFEFGLLKYGFVWAFPIKNGVNVGAGSFLGRQKIDKKKILLEFLESLGIKPNSEEILENRLRVWNGHNRLDGEGLLLVGDAASLCDPFLAEGLRPALLSGYEAAKCLNKWLLYETSDLKDYTLTMKKKWGDSMAWGKRIAQIFYRFPSLGYQLGIKRETAPQRIAQILSGEIGYGDIAERAINRLLLRK